MTIIDNTNELKELIAEYSLLRVVRMNLLYPNKPVRHIELRLDEWKEESISKIEKINSFATNLGYIKSLGCYFDH